LKDRVSFVRRVASLIFRVGSHFIVSAEFTLSKYRISTQVLHRSSGILRCGEILFSVFKFADSSMFEFFIDRYLFFYVIHDSELCLIG
jgi:hypothetical protein